MIEQPIGRIVTDGGHVTLSLSVTGAAPLVFQWWKDEQPLTNSVRIMGATDSVLNIDPAQTNGDSGNYFAIVTNANGAVTSAPVSMVVSQLLFGITPTGATGALVTALGQMGDVYRIEVSENFGPYRTNGYATNFTGRTQYFYRDPGGAGFRNFRVRFDHMLPVLYPGVPEVNVLPLGIKAGLIPFGSVRAYGKLNQVWQFESTANFSNWFSIGTVTNHSGWVKFIDPTIDPGDLKPPRRFYRVAPP